MATRARIASGRPVLHIYSAGGRLLMAGAHGRPCDGLVRLERHPPGTPGGSGERSNILVGLRSWQDVAAAPATALVRTPRRGCCACTCLGGVDAEQQQPKQHRNKQWRHPRW